MLPVRNSPSSTNSKAAGSPTIVRGARQDPTRTKSELLKYLEDSFDYGNRVLATLTAQNALDRTFSPYFCVAGGTMLFMRRYSTSWP